MLLTLTYIFWIFIFVVVYTYIGYGMFLWLLVKAKQLFFGKKKKNSLENTPDITYLIAAYNEEAYVEEKMKNTLAIDYPKDKMHIVWVTDGSNDKTNELLGQYKEVTVLHKPERRGKTAAINRAMTFINTPITIFTDANTMVNAESVQIMVNEFADASVGCVAGEKRICVKKEDGIASGGEGAYWKYESTLKKYDYELHSAMGAAGELYAIRTELFEELSTDTLLDDFMLSMRIVKRGYKIAYCKDAYAIESGSADIKEEEKRKVRIAAGGLQSIWRLRSLLNPFRYGIVTFQYVSHRALRWSITPICLFAIIPLNVILVFADPKPLYIIIWLLQILFYAAATAMYYLNKRNIKNKLLYIPYYFLFMNINVIKGFVYLAKRGKNATGVWEKAKRAA